MAVLRLTVKCIKCDHKNFIVLKESEVREWLNALETRNKMEAEQLLKKAMKDQGVGA